MIPKKLQNLKNKILPKLSHFHVAIYISLSLSFVTIIATTVLDAWSIRYIYNTIYFTFLSFTILSLNTIFFTKHRKFLNFKIRKFLRISFIVIYSAIYLSAAMTFMTTGQMARTQTVLFLSQMNPATITGAIIVFAATLMLLIALAFYKTTTIPEAAKRERKNVKKMFWISIILFTITILVNSTLIRIENPLISDKDALISYQMGKPILGEEISNLTSTYNKPNVIFILLEALSAERVGAYGYNRNVTPNIDKLAAKSIVFTSAYTTSTHSDYAQPGLLSSRYIFTSEYRTDFTKDSPRKFVWDIFKRENYNTGYYSSQDDKWQNMDHYINYTNLDNFSYSRTDGKTDYGSGLAKKDYDHKTADLAVNWLNETIQKPEPFFLYVNFQATHLPRSYPSKYSHFKPDEGEWFIPFDSNSINKYDNSLRYVDIQVGKILNFLEENNISNNTIIILTSDHGEDLENRHDISNHGKSIYEEELIVPAMAFLPGVNHTIIEDKVSHIDFVPTLIDFLGYPAPEEFQGQIMRKNRTIYFVTQSHKYLIGMIQNDKKIILDINRKLSEVYDLESDPGELNNIDSKEYSDLMLKLLFWHHCQKDYYGKELWETNLKTRCALNNNFKI